MFEYFTRPANILSMIPLGTGLAEVNAPEIVEEGSTFDYKVRALGQEMHFLHKVIELTRAVKIVERQLKGLFKEWEHEQGFADASEGGTLITNTIRFEPPGGMLGFLVNAKMIDQQLHKAFDHGYGLLKERLTAK